MPSYVGYGIAFKKGKIVVTAVTMWAKDELTEDELDSKIIEFIRKRWPEEEGWDSHRANITMELSKSEARNLFDNARDTVSVFGE